MKTDLVKLAYRLGYEKAMLDGGFEKRSEGEYHGQAEFPDRGGTRAIGNDWLERFGQFSSLVPTVGAGAFLGSNTANRALGKIKLRGIKGRGLGALAGLGVGLFANLIGRDKAFFTKGRTAQDQIDYDKRLRFKNLFMPGSGAYNASKRKEREKITMWHG